MDTHVDNLLPAYVLGTLEEAEMLLVSEHLANCAACQSKLRVDQETVNSIILSMPKTSAPKNAKARLMKRIHQLGQQETISQPSKNWWQGFISYGQRRFPSLRPLMVLLIAVLLFNNGLLWWRLQQVETPRAKQIVQTGNPYSVGLKGTERMPDARGVLLITSDGRQAILIVEGLEPFENFVYQMWLNHDDQISNVGYFTISEQGRQTVELTAPDYIFNYHDFEITLEPTGGSEEPTGERVMDGLLDILETFEIFDE